MFHVTIFSIFDFGSNYWKPYWAYINARLAKYMACTMDERGFLEFPDPWMDSVQQISTGNFLMFYFKT